MGITSRGSYNHGVNETTAALALLLAVLGVAAFSSRWVAVAASLLAFICYNYFFLLPIHTFRIASTEDVLALFVLLAVSLIGSHLSQQARRSAERAVLAAKQRQEADVARRSAETKSALVASFSHDLKSPLTALTVAAGNIGDAGLSDDERREQIAIVRTEVDRLKRLFDNLIAMASVETHAMSAELDWVHPVDVVEAARLQVRAALAAHPIEVNDASDGRVAHLDPRLTSAALAHVLENAAAYSPSGEPIAVNTRCDRGGLEITVRDRGPGLDGEELTRVFERFYRGSAGAGEKFSSGMGLAIARGLLALQGGGITAGNHPERGAVFRLSIPAATRSADDFAGDLA